MSLSLTEHLGGKALTQFMWQTISKTPPDVKGDPGVVSFLHRSTDVLEKDPIPNNIVPIARVLSIHAAWLVLRPDGEQSIILHRDPKE